jgi:uncharacterized membrane protein YjgN (DUF898 family)
MSDLNKTQRSFTFYGEGSKLFGITIINAILTAITLGFYYPWAKVAKLHYMYHEMEFEGSRFEFHGKGSEVFKGFIKLVVFIIIFYALFFTIAFQAKDHPVLAPIAFLVLYILFLLVIPLAIHGAARYRLSRTSWRGIHFGYRGNRGELFKLFVVGFLLTIVTLGIYGAWFINNIRKYVIGHVRFGDVSFSYKGEGAKYFWLSFGGYLLCIITFGIYLPWYIKKLFNYYVNNIHLEQNGKDIKLNSTVTAGGFFVLFLVNALIVIFTLGLGMAWATIRTMRYIASHIVVVGDFDVEAIQQTEEDFKNATADDLADMLDIDLI